jgi:L-lactate utilization protein LutC
MSTTRESFLQRVRQAVEEGNRAGHAAPLEARGHTGYQGAGPDLVARFRDELTAAGGHVHLVADPEAAVDRVIDLLGSHPGKQILAGRGPFVDPLALPDRLRAGGFDVIEVDRLDPEASRETFFAADVGISGVDYLIAETGTLVLLARPEEPRSISLLPPIHIAVADRNQLLPDLFDLFEPKVWQERGELPSCLSLITGPSKTGDIELKLVTGVHGPGELHVVLING